MEVRAGAAGWAAAATVSGPLVDQRSGAVTFVVADDADARPRRVWYHLREFGDDASFHRVGDHWVARIPPPPVDRIEYLLVVRFPDGRESMVLDPANPHRVAGVFGDHSVLELPGYHPPPWSGSTTPPWTAQVLAVGAPMAALDVRGELLTPPGFSRADPLPLLVVHDGPEYVRLARLLDYLHWLTDIDDSLVCRVLALQPVRRDLAYAGSAGYTATLVDQALPRAREAASTVGPLVGLGASLGALALAHAAASHPGTFAGLVCQSGSFFRPEFDAHERGWPHFAHVVAATARLHDDPSPLAGVVTRLTAGLGEENLENNRALAARLAGLGVDATIAEGRDGHNHTAWRDLLHPTLGQLLARCWATPAAG
jgi:enterochelin esterase-like enzyme